MGGAFLSAPYAELAAGEAYSHGFPDYMCSRDSDHHSLTARGESRHRLEPSLCAAQQQDVLLLVRFSVPAEALQRAMPSSVRYTRASHQDQDQDQVQVQVQGPLSPLMQTHTRDLRIAGLQHLQPAKCIEAGAAVKQ